jgi:hypothetical protein
MAVRTASSDVQAIMGNDYDGTTSLIPFIATASSVVDRLATLDSGALLSATQLELIERWVSAHCYCLMDRQLQEKSTGKSKGIITGTFGKMLDMTSYGQMAKMLDFTGKLSAIGGPKASMSWLGLAKSTQTDYEDRD